MKVSNGRVFEKASAVRSEDAKTLVARIVKATRRPGVDRSVIFRSGTSKKVYAYSVLPSDPSKIVREAEDGSQIIGRLRNGQFRALRAQRAQKC